MTVRSDLDDIVFGIRDMYEAFLTADRQRFDQHLAPGTTTWETHFPRMYSRAELDAYRDARTSAERPVLDDIRVDVVRSTVWDDVAVVGYVLTTYAPDGGTTTSRVTDVLERIDGEWRIVHHHAEARDDREQP